MPTKDSADFSRRSTERELMDQEDISFEEFHDCLQNLERINALTLAYRPTLQWLKPWLASAEPLTIIDAGSGGGDMLRRIDDLATKATRKISLIGVDLNGWSKKSAELAASRTHIRFETADVFSFDAGQAVDLIICSLFTHHLSDEEIVRFLRWADSRARKGWFINDLHRHPLPYHFIKVATALLSRNRLVRNDAAVSVARSFTVADWQRLLEQAGLKHRAHVQRFFPFRICVSCSK